jgi:excisionase family DNA binding protein
MPYYPTHSPDEVSKILGVTRRTVYSWITLGRLPAHKVGPKLWVVYSDVLQVYMAGGDARRVFDEIQLLAVDPLGARPARSTQPIRPTEPARLIQTPPVVQAAPALAPILRNPHSSTKKKLRR